MTTVLVPFNPQGCEWRDKAFRWVRDWWGEHFPQFQLVVGGCEGEWSKGAALADAYQWAGSGPLILADADLFVPPSAIVAAVSRVNAGEPWVAPHKWVYRLGDEETRRVYAGYLPRKKRMEGDRKTYVGPLGGGITVLSHETWLTVGGVDPLFYGWGGEDLCFGWALMTLCPHPLSGDYRVGADLFHLYHPRANPRGTLHKPRGSDESEERLARYRKATGRPDDMRELIAEWTSPISSLRQ